MLITWFFIMLSIVCALVADKIDRAVNGDKKVRKVILVFCAGVFLVSVIGLAVR